MHDQKTPDPAAETPVHHGNIHRGKPKAYAAGAQAVLQSFRHVFGQSGFLRGAGLMLQLNQKGGFDCPSCAWPDPEGHRALTEFCENGAKAMASETTLARADREFFARHSVAEFAEQDDHWLERAGRLTEPMILRQGDTHYRPISWEDAFLEMANALNALDDPNQASFYTSGRASNEAAFLWALFARRFGTNNLPDCSNMCHESSGSALTESIGVGKGTVTLGDFDDAGVIFCVGQNPGTNHPRMLAALQSAVRKGARIVAVNPLIEAGLKGFAHPQEPLGMLGKATPLASDYLQVRINGDQALYLGLNKALLALEEARPGQVLDQTFIETQTQGFDAYRNHLAAVDWKAIEDASGISRAEIERIAALCAGKRKIITCWAMGLTQQPNAVATIQEVVHFHLLLGAIGLPGGGLCPVRGHSNVQGDRTMGICHHMPESYFQAVEKQFGFQSPREEGLDVVASIRAMNEGRVKVFIALGGNFLQASPDTHFTGDGLRQCSLTAHVATKLNRSHLVTGDTGLILPCLGRSETDEQASGPQFVTVENSMGIVHPSQGTLNPASPHLLSETAFICRLAEATFGPGSGVPWPELEANYDRVRDLIGAIIPGFENFNARARQPGGFYLPNAARDRRFETPSGKALFLCHPLQTTELDEGELLLQTFRSHDQFNTTVYGLNDRYRGISNERRIVFLNPEDMRERGLSPLQPLDITSHFNGQTRTVHDFLAIPYEQPRRMAAAYFPEANPLVPIDSVAPISNTPTSKAVRVTVAPAKSL